MKSKKFLLSALLLVFALLICTACGKGGNIEKKIVGSWYMDGRPTVTRDGEYGPTFTFYDDGTCQIASEYGVCEWAIVNDNQLKLTNYYGETSVAEISEITKDTLTLFDGHRSMYYQRTCASTATEESGTSFKADVREENENMTVSLTLAYEFVDGIAWVNYIDPEGNSAGGIMNTTGEIMAAPVDDPSFLGWVGREDIVVSYKEGDNEQFILMTVSGNIILKSPNDGSYRMLAGGNGVFLVQQYADNEEEKDRIGLMRQDGTWIKEPAEENVLSLSVETQETFQEAYAYYAYCGEHIFSAYHFEADSDELYLSLYNLDTGEKAEYKNVLIANRSDGPYGSFFNGKMVAVSADMIYCVHTDLSIEPIMENDENKFLAVGQGIFFAGDRQEPDSKYIVNGRFYRADGSVMADLSQYTLVADDALNFYNDSWGCAAVLIYSGDGSYYLGIVGADGRFAFDPVQINYEEAIVSPLGDGLISVRTLETVEGEERSKHMLLTVKGEKTELYTEPDVEELRFWDGYAVVQHVTWSDESHSVGRIRQNEYIDVNGNYLVPVLKAE